MKTKTTHTPGPWEIGGLMRNESIVIKGADGLHVAEAIDFNSFNRDAEKEANARLIAAAPELLAFIKHLVDGAEGEASVSETWLLERAKHLIAKANGNE